MSGSGRRAPWGPPWATNAGSEEPRWEESFPFLTALVALAQMPQRRGAGSLTHDVVHTSRYNGRVNTRDRLVAATRELMWEKGYAATSPKDIQRAAGAGQGSMYHHFSGKEDLAVTAMEQTAASVRHDLEQLLSGPWTAPERLERYLTYQRDCLRGCRIGRMTSDAEVVVSTALRAPVSETFTWLIDALTRIIADGVAAGELSRTVRPPELASVVVAVVQGGYVLARAQGETAPFDTAIRGAIYLLRAVAI